MGEVDVNPVEEIRDILEQLRMYVTFNRDWGLEPPVLGPSSLSYLEGGREDADSLEFLRALIGPCERCKLHRERTNLVFGEGASDARLVFVGEGPGREEDMEGRPFVGEAGRLLTKIVKAMNLSREEVYICNVVKCRPPNNRDPEPDEIDTCMPFLRRQIDLIRPEVICTLGRVAVQALLGREFKITRERGEWRTFMGIPLMPTFHPAYLLRNPAAKRQVWEDVQKIMKRLGLEGEKHA
ncbi:MAG: uracil-DNA glycosylase [Deltaproteobacteria bacterium]|nr:uracil-DNA glycosylase [Deltaproteobacteria bacterium]